MGTSPHRLTHGETEDEPIVALLGKGWGERKRRADALEKIQDASNVGLTVFNTRGRLAPELGVFVAERSSGGCTCRLPLRLEPFVLCCPADVAVHVVCNDRNGALSCGGHTRQHATAGKYFVAGLSDEDNYWTCIKPPYIFSLAIVFSDLGYFHWDQTVYSSFISHRGGCR
jgi:hypothetical protein